MAMYPRFATRPLFWLAMLCAFAFCAGASEAPVRPSWTIALNSSASPPAGVQPGYAALSKDGRFYALTESSGALVVIDVLSGALHWTYNHWNCSSSNGAKAYAACLGRQIVFGGGVIVVLQGDELVSFDVASGKKLASGNVPQLISAGSASLQMLVNRTGLLYDGVSLVAFDVVRLSSALSPIWTATNLQNEFGSAIRVDPVSGHVASLVNGSSVVVFNATGSTVLTVAPNASNLAFAYVSWVGAGSVLFLNQQNTGAEYACRHYFGQPSTASASSPAPSSYCTEITTGAGGNYVTGYGLASERGGQFALPDRLYAATLDHVVFVNFTTGQTVGASMPFPESVRNVGGLTHLVGLSDFASISYVEPSNQSLCVNGYNFGPAASNDLRFHFCFGNVSYGTTNRYAIVTNYNNEIFVPCDRGFYFILGKKKELVATFADNTPDGVLDSSVWVTADRIIFASGARVLSFDFTATKSQ